jgi:hypothetical protein
MAIFVSNPTSVVSQPLSSDALDPAALAANAGFTEELAAAMLPSGEASDAALKTPTETSEETGKKASDLQILPAEVLLNAVGDANFALASQTAAPIVSNANVPDASASQEAEDLQLQDAKNLELAANLKGAELAAANLAAQTIAVAPTPATGQSDRAVKAVDSAAHVLSTKPKLSSSLSAAAQGAATALGSDVSTPSNTAPELTANVQKQASIQALDAAAKGPTDRGLPSVPANLLPTDSNSKPQSLGADSLNAVSLAQQASTEVQPDQVKTLVTHLSTPAAPSQANTARLPEPGTSALAAAAQALPSVAAAAPDLASMDSTSTQNVNTQAAATQVILQLASADTVQVHADLSASTEQLVKLSSVTPQTTTQVMASQDAKAAQTSQQTQQAQESSFNFDAKLAKTDAQNLKEVNKALQTVATNSGAANMANANVQAQASNTLSVATGSLAQAAASPNKLQDDVVMAASTGTSFTAASSSSVSSTRSQEGVGAIAPSSAATGLVETDSVSVQAPASQVADVSHVVQDEPRSVATQSLEDLSSSFVSSLVGGPQRPVNTVMDWISLQSQERPAPVLPHEVRLDAGAVQLEIQKMVKQGGGHVVMELTPPDQSKFTIELKLDDIGGALLVVEGVSDSTRTRLEQSAPQLREQFQQMGLELQLDMRQQSQSASSGASNFADAQDRRNEANPSGKPGTDTPTPLSTREAGAMRARETGANQVYLYA